MDSKEFLRMTILSRIRKLVNTRVPDEKGARMIHRYEILDEIFGLGNGIRANPTSTADTYRRMLTETGYLHETSKKGTYRVVKAIPDDLTVTQLKEQYNRSLKMKRTSRNLGI